MYTCKTLHTYQHNTAGISPFSQTPAQRSHQLSWTKHKRGEGIERTVPRPPQVGAGGRNARRRGSRATEGGGEGSGSDAAPPRRGWPTTGQASPPEGPPQGPFLSDGRAIGGRSRTRWWDCGSNIPGILWTCHDDLRHFCTAFPLEGRTAWPHSGHRKMGFQHRKVSSFAKFCCGLEKSLLAGRTPPGGRFPGEKSMG